MEKQYKNFPFAISEEEKDGQIISRHTEEEHPMGLSNKRPTLITVLCGYFFVGKILSIIHSLYSLLTHQKMSYPIEVWISSFFSLLIIVSIFGYWFMRRWAVYLYTFSTIFFAIYILVQAKSLLLTSLLISLPLHLTVIISGFYYLKQMK